MPADVVPLSHSDEWEPRDKDLKRYLHFDRKISERKIKKYCNNPKKVEAHAFFPLLRYSQEWVKFRGNSDKRVKKKRPIRYAARLDAAIFAKYRSELSNQYEDALKVRDLASVPTAYRQIPNLGMVGNKSNIDLAKDIFDKILEMENCTVTVVDISSYFEKIDHENLRARWEELISKPLPPDHAAVFRAVTQYSVVDYKPMAERLGLYEKSKSGNRFQRRLRRIDELRRNGHAQICDPVQFRQLICGGNPNFPSLIQKNTLPYGIPQGTPISDILANIYLIDFDARLNKYTKGRGGIYRRYSDDIICIVPNGAISDPLEVKNVLQAEIKKEGSELRIKDSKVAVCRFQTQEESLSFSHIYGSASKNGLEYLGFQFDGLRVALKDSTLSNAWRKLKRRSYGFARRYVRRYRGKGRVWIVKHYPIDLLLKKFITKVTYGQDIGYDVWTFRSYVRRASRVFIGYETIFSRQTKKYRELAEMQIVRDLNLAIARHYDPT